MEQQHHEPSVVNSAEWLEYAGRRLTKYMEQDIKNLPAASPQEVIIFPRDGSSVNVTDGHE